MAAGLENCLESGDRVLMSQFGQFSKLWVQMCEDMNLSVHNIAMDWGDATPIDRYRNALENDTKKDIKASHGMSERDCNRCDQLCGVSQKSTG